MNLPNLRYFLDTTTNTSWVLPWGETKYSHDDNDDDLDDDDDVDDDYNMDDNNVDDVNDVDDVDGVDDDDGAHSCRNA